MAKKSKADEVLDGEPADEVKAMTFEMMQELKKPVRANVPICLDSTLTNKRDELERLKGQAEMAVARQGDDADPELVQALAEVVAEYEAAVADAEAASVTFVFKAIGRKHVEDMMKEKEHTPTAEQRKDWQAQLRQLGIPATEKLNYNPDTFPPALIAAASVEPDMTLEQAKEIWDDEDWSRGELGQLFQAAWSVNEIVV